MKLGSGRQCKYCKCMSGRQHKYCTFVSGVEMWQSVCCRRSDIGSRPPRSPLSGCSPLNPEHGGKSVHDSDFGGPATQRAMSVPSELIDPATSFGSENESLGLNQRAALSELHKYTMQ